MAKSFKELFAQFFDIFSNTPVTPTGSNAGSTSTTSPVTASPTVDVNHTLVPPPPALPQKIDATVTKISSPTISIMNKCSILRDEDVKAAVAALQIQLDRDFSPVWGISATLQFLPKNTPLPVHHWLIALMDTSDQAGALGYHDLTDEGLPVAKIFAKDDQKYGLAWTVTLSHELCLTGDTKIPLLDGTSVAIRDLVGREYFYVYSCDENGNVKHGKGHSARITQKNAPTVKVLLDNGQEVRCTGNHPFLMRDGSYKDADKLNSGDSLMPLYRQQKSIDMSKRNSLYEQVYNPGSGDWKFTHRVVQPHCSSGYVRHHKDFNRFNNTPENIQVMKWEDHQRLHSEHITHHLREFIASGKQRVKHPEGDAGRALNAERVRKMALEYNGSEKQRLDIQKYFSSEENKKQHSNAIKKALAGVKDTLSANMRRRMSEPEEKNKARERRIEYNQSAARISHIKDVWLNKSDDELLMHSMYSGETAHNRWHVKRTKYNDECIFCLAENENFEYMNHKVISVEPCGFEDVYDITVDKYHNFALEAGVFVHNCEMLVDPYIANCCFVQDSNTTGTLYAYEVADAVEDDSLGYKINDILVSNFVYPSWFEGFRKPNSTKFDFTGKLRQPFELAAGGYISTFVVGPNSQGWTQLTSSAKHGARLRRKGPESRTNRRKHSKPKLIVKTDGIGKF